VDLAPGLLCVHAHPDDESLWTGGVLARYAAEGVRTAVVTCTAGERAGSLAGPNAADQVAEVRLRELARALDLLGAGRPRLLGYRDSGLDGGFDPGSLWRAELDEAVRRLVWHLREFRPDVLVTYDAKGLYGHPDHLQAHRITLVAAEAAAAEGLYPAVGPPWRVRKLYLVTVPRSMVALARRELDALGLARHVDRLPLDPGAMGTPDHEVTTAVDVRPFLRRKWAALQAHASQLGPASALARLPGPLRDAVLGTEWFVRYGGPAQPDGQGVEDDLLAGVRELRG
jgi:N-acetyl-1-D-myo-inositol-2-amino-2-deoxy-alpha-D-glucopyranoside deacetylase